MKILAADDEQTALNILIRAITEAAPEAELKALGSVSAVLDELFKQNYKPDVIFLDADMPAMPGLELAYIIKQELPDVNIVFTADDGRYAVEAFSLHSSGYLIKPVTAEKLVGEFENLRYTPCVVRPAKKIFIQCFGNFEVFADGKPVAFSRTKSKEMLAYLVDRRGVNCKAALIANALFDDGIYDRSRQKLLSTIRTDMIKSLKQAGADIILKKSLSSIAVDTDMFDCDYYMALAGDTFYINQYIGEYMVAYSWAEFTTAALTAKFGVL